MIGPKIRQFRSRKGLTLQELARKTGTTAGFLSQLERNLTEPSLATLRKIASALEVPIFTLLNEDPLQAAFVPAQSRHQISFADSSVVYEILTPSSEAAEGPDFLMMTFSLPPQCFASEDRVSHDSEECLYMTSGNMEVLVGDTTYRLEAGDCVRIPSNAPHNLYNPGDVPATGFSCMKPGTFVSTVRP